MKIETFDSVWDAVGARLSGKYEGSVPNLLRSLITGLNNKGLARLGAASALGFTQPRISELARGKIQIFSIDKLITMMAPAWVAYSTY